MARRYTAAMARRYTADEVGGVMDDLSDMSIDEDDLSELEDTDIELSDDELSYTSETSIDNSDKDDSTSTNSSDWRTWGPSDSDFSLVPFSARNVGVNLDEVPECELECFQNFMPDEVLNAIVTATNAHATIQIPSSKRKDINSVWHKWKDITLEDQKAYLGVILQWQLMRNLI